jgi:hypothetical protein
MPEIGSVIVKEAVLKTSSKEKAPYTDFHLTFVMASHGHGFCYGHGQIRQTMLRNKITNQY